MKHLLSKIPAINKILMTEEVKQLLEEYPEVFVKDIVKKETENIKIVTKEDKKIIENKKEIV